MACLVHSSRTAASRLAPAACFAAFTRIRWPSSGSRFLSSASSVDIMFSKTHEYLKPIGDTNAELGISTYAVNKLGDVVFVELPNVGDKFKANESFANVESVKAVGDVYMPVDSTISEVNSTLVDSPESLNNHAEGAGWLVKINADIECLDNLLCKNGGEMMTSKEYEEYCKELVE